MVLLVLLFYCLASFARGSNDGACDVQDARDMNQLFFVIMHDNNGLSSTLVALKETWVETLELQRDFIVLTETKYRLNLLLTLRAIHEIFAQRSELKWVLLCESTTFVNVTNLRREIHLNGNGQSSGINSPILKGFGLFDSDVSPIHHYWGQKDFLKSFLYPFVRAGMLLNRMFIEKIVSGIDKSECVDNFQIDPSFELMKCISNHFQEYIGVRTEIVNRAIITHVRASTLPLMQHDPRFCLLNGHNIDDSNLQSNCLTIATTSSDQMYRLHGKTVPPTLSLQSNTLLLSEIAFGVSTHPQSPYNDFVKQTWGKSRALTRNIENVPIHEEMMDAKDEALIDIIFFSHQVNQSLPSVDVGIENVNKGFCGKSERIFAFWAKHYLDLPYPSHFSQQDKRALDQAVVDLSPVDNLKLHTAKKWFFRADDDTSISPQRLVAVLSKYDPDEPLFIGQVYGYQESPYLTGGAGVAMSRGALRKWATCGDGCRCPSIDFFDDMFIGRCCDNLGVRLIHEPGFHQEVPSVYQSDLLFLDKPVSFHRIPKRPNPLDVYREFLA